MPELLSPIRIAILDSQTMLRDGLRKLLEQEQGFQVVAEAGNDVEAMEVVHEHKPDLLLLEVADCPTGFSALERIQNANPKIRTIVLTANDEEGTIVRAMKHGARGIVFKSMPIQRLIEAIRKVHDGGVWLDARCQAVVVGEFRSPAVTADDPLTQREHQIADLVAKGYRNEDIAAALSITHHTVRNHIYRVFRKLKMIVLRRKGCLPFGFFLIVLGGFFLGAASRSSALAAEINAGIGFTFFLVGYLIVHFESRRVSIEVTEPLTRAQRVAAIERLVEADGIPVAPGLAIVPELPVQENQLQLQESQPQLFA